MTNDEYVSYNGMFEVIAQYDYIFGDKYKLIVGDGVSVIHLSYDSLVELKDLLDMVIASE